MSPKRVRSIIIWAGVVIIAIFLASNAFVRVNAQEAGLVLRFGQYHTDLQPGLNLILPFIDRGVKVVAEQQQEFGVGRLVEADSDTTQASFYELLRQKGIEGVDGDFSNEDLKMEEANTEQILVITGDRRLISVKWDVKYYLRDPSCGPDGREITSPIFCNQFLVEEPLITLREVAESVIREVVGNHFFEELLSEAGAGNIENLVVNRMSELLAEYKAGIQLDSVLIQFQMPQQVYDYWQIATRAEEEARALVESGARQRDVRIQNARGDADRLREDARGYAEQRRAQGRGELARYLMIYNEYRRQPSFQARRIFLEEMTSALRDVNQLTLIPETSTPIIGGLTDMQRGTLVQGQPNESNRSQAPATSSISDQGLTTGRTPSTNAATASMGGN